MATNISIYSSTPRTEFRGIKDGGAVSISMPVESTPIRFPFFASFAPFGDYKEAVAVNGSTIALTHGNETINARSKFFTHQSLMARSHFQGGGSAMFLRLKADGSKQASLRLGIDIVEDDIVQYERNPDGTYKRNVDGDLVVTGAAKDGFRAQFRVIEIPTIGSEFDYGKGTSSEGTMTAIKDGGPSTFYPIMDLIGRWDGDLYNNIGFKLYAPNTKDREPLDSDVCDRIGARTYRLQAVQRANSNASAQTILTETGEPHLNFSFKPDTVDLQMGDKEYDLVRILKDAYESEDPTQFTGYGPFENVKVYQNNLTTVLEQLCLAEALETSETFDEIHQFNLLTGSDVDGVPYYTYTVEGPQSGGVLLTENTSHYLRGGADGDVSNTALNAKWDELLDGLETTQIPFDDIAKMPFDIVVDSGFPIETKLKFVNFHNMRPDVYPHICTQDVSMPLNSPSEDSSVTLTLRSHFRSMIESPEFGTKATRFAIFNCAGYFANDDYKGLVPFMEYIISKGANYMGATDGKMRSQSAFGRGEQNVVTRYVRHNAGQKPLQARNTDWANGVNYPEAYDMKRLFYPGLQSIYSDHTSPLHSYFNVQIACNVTRLGHVIWRELSGDDQLNDGVFLQEVNRRLAAKVHEAYDGRTIITPNAYYTALDTDLGTHWHLDAECQFRNIKTAQVLAIIAQRMRTEA